MKEFVSLLLSNNKTYIFVSFHSLRRHRWDVADTNDTVDCNSDDDDDDESMFTVGNVTRIVVILYIEHRPNLIVRRLYFVFVVFTTKGRNGPMVETIVYERYFLCPCCWR